MGVVVVRNQQAGRTIDMEGDMGRRKGRLDMKIIICLILYICLCEKSDR